MWWWIDAQGRLMYKILILFFATQNVCEITQTSAILWSHTICEHVVVTSCKHHFPFCITQLSSQQNRFSCVKCEFEFSKTQKHRAMVRRFNKNEKKNARQIKIWTTGRRGLFLYIAKACYLLSSQIWDKKSCQLNFYASREWKIFSSKRNSKVFF